MAFFSYVVARDYGFAPNPFNGMCTLATCKPKIRKSATVGDWVFGTSSKKFNSEQALIFAMEVSEKITFDDYWNGARYQTKKPVMNGSLKKMFGDNIYHSENGTWIQADSHHSLEGGLPNHRNISRDTSTNAVLVSNRFYYFGKNAMLLPRESLAHVVKKGPGYRRVEKAYGEQIIALISGSFCIGYHGDPIQFSHFERFRGES